MLIAFSTSPFEFFWTIGLNASFAAFSKSSDATVFQNNSLLPRFQRKNVSLVIVLTELLLKF